MKYPFGENNIPYGNGSFFQFWNQGKGGGNPYLGKAYANYMYGGVGGGSKFYPNAPGAYNAQFTNQLAPNAPPLTPQTGIFQRAQTGSAGSSFNFARSFGPQVSSRGLPSSWSMAEFSVRSGPNMQQTPSNPFLSGNAGAGFKAAGIGLGAWSLMNDPGAFQSVGIPTAIYGALRTPIQKGILTPIGSSLNNWAANSSSMSGWAGQGGRYLSGQGFGMNTATFGGKTALTAARPIVAAGTGTVFAGLSGAYDVSRSFSADPETAHRGQSGLAGLAAGVAGGAWLGLPGAIGFGLLGYMGANALPYQKNDIYTNQMAFSRSQEVNSYFGAIDGNLSLANPFQSVNPELNGLQKSAQIFETALDAFFGAAGPVVSFPSQLLGAPTRQELMGNYNLTKEQMLTGTGAFQGVPLAATLGGLGISGNMKVPGGGRLADWSRGGLAGHIDQSIVEWQGRMRSSQASRGVYGARAAAETTIGYGMAARQFMNASSNEMANRSAMMAKWQQPVLGKKFGAFGDFVNNVKGNFSTLMGAYAPFSSRDYKQAVSAGNTFNVYAQSMAGRFAQGRQALVGSGGNGGGGARPNYYAQQDAVRNAVADNWVATSAIPLPVHDYSFRPDYHAYDNKAGDLRLNSTSYSDVFASYKSTEASQLAENEAQYKSNVAADTAYMNSYKNQSMADIRRVSGLPGGKDEAKQMTARMNGVIQEMTKQIKQSAQAFEANTKQIKQNTETFEVNTKNQAAFLSQSGADRAQMQVFSDTDALINARQQIALTKKQNRVMSTASYLDEFFGTEREKVRNMMARNDFQIGQDQAQITKLRGSGVGGADLDLWESRLSDDKNLQARLKGVLDDGLSDEALNRAKAVAYGQKVSKYSAPAFRTLFQGIGTGNMAGMASGLYGQALGGLADWANQKFSIGLGGMFANAKSAMRPEFGPPAPKGSILNSVLMQAAGQYGGAGKGVMGNLMGAMQNHPYIAGAAGGAIGMAAAGAIYPKISADYDQGVGAAGSMLGGLAGFAIGNAVAPGIGGFIGAGIGSMAGGATGLLGFSKKPENRFIAQRGRTRGQAAMSWGIKGAATGAIVGGAIAGLLTGGLGFFAGAAIGAGVGGILGAGAGAAFGSKNGKMGPAGRAAYRAEVLGPYLQSLKDIDPDNFTMADINKNIKLASRGMPSHGSAGHRMKQETMKQLKAFQKAVKPYQQYFEAPGGVKGALYQFGLNTELGLANQNPFAAGVSNQLYQNYSSIQQNFGTLGLTDNTTARALFTRNYQNQQSILGRSIQYAQEDLGFQERGQALNAQSRGIERDQFDRDYLNFDRDSQRDLEKLLGTAQRTGNRAAYMSELKEEQRFNRGILDRQRNLLYDSQSLDSDSDSSGLSRARQEIADMVDSQRLLQENFNMLAPRIGDVNDELYKMYKALKDINDAMRLLR